MILSIPIVFTLKTNFFCLLQHHFWFVLQHYPVLFLFLNPSLLSPPGLSYIVGPLTVVWFLMVMSLNFLCFFCELHSRFALMVANVWNAQRRRKKRERERMGEREDEYRLPQHTRAGLRRFPQELMQHNVGSFIIICGGGTMRPSEGST